MGSESTARAGKQVHGGCIWQLVGDWWVDLECPPEEVGSGAQLNGKFEQYRKCKVSFQPFYPHDRKGGGLIRTSIKSWLRNLISSDISNRFFPRSFWALVVFTLLLTDLRPHCRILQRGWHLSSRSIDWSLFWMSPALHTCPTPRYRDGGVNHPVLTPYTSVFTH